MDKYNINIPETLQRTSNAIMAFVIIQSILLSYQLRNHDFLTELNNSGGMKEYIIVGQIFIVLGSIIGITYISKKIRKFLDKETNSHINPVAGLIIKILLIFYFGIIPIVILLIPHTITR
jgi:hypothetical protein